MNSAPLNHRTRDKAAISEERLANQDACAAIAQETFTPRQSKPCDANGPLRSHPAVIALVRLLARQAAQEALMASHVEQETQNDAEEA